MVTVPPLRTRNAGDLCAQAGAQAFLQFGHFGKRGWFRITGRLFPESLRTNVLGSGRTFKSWAMTVRSAAALANRRGQRQQGACVTFRNTPFDKGIFYRIG